MARAAADDDAHLAGARTIFRDDGARAARGRGTSPTKFRKNI
jgi:hypothetical protein